jgi:dipeptidyl aminopeptidase/acylaminoacyl peptidase
MRCEAIFRRGIAAAAILILALSSALWAGDAMVESPIAYVGTDSNIYYCKHDCSKAECLTCPVKGLEVRAPGERRMPGIVDASMPVAAQGPADYNWPTYSPDGTRLAYVATGQGEDGLVFSVYVYDFKTKNAIKVFENNNQRPIYLFWLADSHKLSFLLAGPQGLSLMLADVREAAPVRLVARGVPLYFDWNLSRHKLAVHTNSEKAPRTEQIYLMSLNDKGQSVDKVLSLDAAAFKAPAWSRDGKRLAYVANSGGHATLYISDGDGRNPKPMLSLPDGENSIVWAPDSRRIAYSTAPPGENLMYNGIGLLDTATGKTNKLVQEPVAAFCFSPDSRRLAYIAIPRGPFFSWDVADVASGKHRHLADFVTTGEEAIAYRYFDQLALSHSIWSPRSDALIFAGVLIHAEGETMAPMMSPPPSVWVVPIAKGPPRSVAEGKLAFWSPVAGN